MGFRLTRPSALFYMRVPAAIDSTRGSQADDNPRLRKPRLEIALSFRAFIQSFIFSCRIFAIRILHSIMLNVSPIFRQSAATRLSRCVSLFS